MPSRMNSTIWSSTEEAVVSFILAPITIFVFAYAIFLCYAIYDYQDEKPKDENSPTDVIIKDLKNVEFCTSLFSKSEKKSDIIFGRLFKSSF